MGCPHNAEARSGREKSSQSGLGGGGVRGIGGFPFPVWSVFRLYSVDMQFAISLRLSSLCEFSAMLSLLSGHPDGTGPRGLSS